ncbi:serine-rich adhesin for platelets [Anopheles stephensi]|nr:serine-rich adhesin for platelets [Anopheles stephensi]XP_035901106.1 serine-rich adhesin for platelets [Anopheles stephensi]XP_035901107.1 serine-rich adhesin for platelets [Anopheles stephensi]
MSAPEDTTATAQLASDNHHQQNVVSPSAASSSSSTSSSVPAVVAAGAVTASATAAAPAAASSPLPTPTNAGSSTVTTLSAAITGPAATSAADSAAGSGSAVVPATVPANNGSNNSHVKEGAAVASNSATPDENNGSSAPADAADVANSCDSDKGPATTAATTSSPPRPNQGISPGVGVTSDSLASIEAGSTGGTSTPIAGASPASVSGGEITVTTLCGVSSLAGNINVGSAVTNGAGGGGASNSSVPVSVGTTISVRGRGDITDKNSLEYHCRMLEDELQSTKESEAKIKQQYSESQRRERILARRVAVQEQEMRDYAKQIAELKSAQAPGPAALRSALLDPAVNILFQKLKAELQATKAKLEETQNELSAWKFTPDSNTGKRLMAKCRLLYQENEELGKMTSNGRLAKLESELALQKSYNEEVKKSQLELDDFLQELDEDVEGMQGTIVFLQQELKQTKDSRDEMERELVQLRAYIAANLGPFSGSANNPTSGSTPTDERSSSMMLMMDAQDSSSNSNSHGHDAYHHPDGGGPDSIGGGGGGGSSRVGDMGGGVTPIYLVNGGGSGSGSGGSGNSDAESRLVNKSSSSGDDHDMMVYSNRTHCGGVVTNSNELRTTPTTGSGGLSVADSTNSPSTAAAAAVNGGSSAAVGSSSGGDPLVNELKDPLLPRVASSDGNGRSSSGNADSKSGGCVADVDNSVNSTNSSHSNSNAALKPHPPQQRPSNNVGRNGGRTTVAARKRNYDETEVDSAGLLQTDGSDVVSSGAAYGSDSGVDGGVLVKDVGGVSATESSASSAGGLANGKLTLNVADGSHLAEQQQPDVEPNINKRMTRSGKGKATIAPATASVLSSSTSTSSPSSSSSSVSASNVLMTSAAKKLRRGSIAPDDEVDPLSDAHPAPQQQQQQQQQQQTQQPQQQTISSANGSN